MEPCADVNQGSAPRLKARPTADVAFQLGIARAINFAHAACAEWREDLVGSEFVACNKGICALELSLLD